MNELQAKWASEWNATSTHKFRSPDDMQYAFSYYYYVIHRDKAVLPDLEAFLRQFVDTNEDGFLDEQELRFLTVLVKNKSPKEEDIEAIRACIVNASTSAAVASINGTSSNSDTNETDARSHANLNEVDLFLKAKHTETKTTRTRVGKIEQSTTLTLWPTLDEALLCPLVPLGLKSNVDWSKLHPTHTLGSEKDISFEMIGDNVTEAIAMLDSIRLRRSKFICINDNIKHPSPPLLLALEQFFLSFFPFPSPFELPEGVSNPTLYVDEFRNQSASPLLGHTTNPTSLLDELRVFFRTSSRAHLASLFFSLLDALKDPEPVREANDDDKVDANRLRERALKKLKMNGGGSQKDRDKSHPSQQPTFFRSSFFIISIVALRGLWYLVMGGSSHRTKRDN